MPAVPTAPCTAPMQPRSWLGQPLRGRRLLQSVQDVPHVHPLQPLLLGPLVCLLLLPARLVLRLQRPLCLGQLPCQLPPLRVPLPVGLRHHRKEAWH